MTRTSEINDRERLDSLGEINPGFRENVAYKTHPIRSRRLLFRWKCLLFSALLSVAPILLSHWVPGSLARGAFNTQTQVNSHAETSVTTQGLVAATENPPFSLRINSKQSAELIESEQTDAPTEEGTDTHGATDDDGDDDEDDDDDDDDGAGLSTDAPLVEHAETNILRLSPESILTL